MILLAKHLYLLRSFVGMIGPCVADLVRARLVAQGSDGCSVFEEAARGS